MLTMVATKKKLAYFFKKPNETIKLILSQGCVKTLQNLQN